MIPQIMWLVEGRHVVSFLSDQTYNIQLLDDKTDKKAISRDKTVLQMDEL